MNMKRYNNLSRLLCSLSVSTVLLAGVANAAGVQPTNNMPMNATKSTQTVAQVQQSPKQVQQQVVKQGSAQSQQVDHVGAVSILHHYYPDAKVTSIAYEATSKPMYEVEAFTDKEEVEVKVDAASGQVLSKDAKAIDTSKQRDTSGINLQKVISPKQATAKAVEQVGSDFKLVDWELTTEDGTAVYEFDLVDPSNHQVNIILDATSGQVVGANVDKQ